MKMIGTVLMTLTRIGVFLIASPLMLVQLVMGLGVGYLPQCLAAAVAAKNELVIRRTEEPKVSQMLYMAWRTTHRGKALKWFVEQVSTKGWLDRALHATCEKCLVILLSMDSGFPFSRQPAT